MTELELLIRGIIAGLIIAVPVGPVNIRCMSRTIAGGWWAGVSSGIGAAAADTVYGAVAGFSITFVIQFLLKEDYWIRLVGGILLVGVGVSYFFKKPATLKEEQQERTGTFAELRLTFFLTLTNPTTVLSFLAVLAALGMEQRRQWWLTVFLVAGIFCGSMLWWIVLSTIVNRFRDRFNDRGLLWMNRIAGAAIGGFGIISFVVSQTRK